MAKDSNYKKHDVPYKAGTGYGTLWQAPEDPATYINWNDEILKTHFLDGWMKETSSALAMATKELRKKVQSSEELLAEIEKAEADLKTADTSDLIDEIQKRIEELNLHFARAKEEERAAGKKAEKITIEGPMKKMYQMLDFVATGGNKIGNEFKKLANSAIQFYRIASVYASNAGIKARDFVRKLCDNVSLLFTKGLAWLRAGHIDSVRDKQLGYAGKIGGNFDNSGAISHVELNHRTKTLRNEIEVLEARIDFCEKWDDGKEEN